jgi:hypothetical protein
MQTFLPYPDFDRSAACLDSPRLGKQRVETLQILRALTFPSYGWSNHPATLMWRGYVAALTRYGLAMTDAWTGRGAADTTRSQIAEFAPEAAATPISGLAVPSWLGKEELHRSHQSNLIRKDPAFYGPQFPGVPDNLDYFWPGTDTGIAERVVVGTPLIILRPRDDAQLAEWIELNQISLTESSPVGRQGPKWRAQRESFADLKSGTRIAVLGMGGAHLHAGEILGDLDVVVNDGTNPTETLVRDVRFDAELARSDFPYPALLQDPRTLFEAVGPLA